MSSALYVKALVAPGRQPRTLSVGENQADVWNQEALLIRLVASCGSPVLVEDLVF